MSAFKETTKLFNTYLNTIVKSDVLTVFITLEGFNPNGFTKILIDIDTYTSDCKLFSFEGNRYKDNFIPRMLEYSVEMLLCKFPEFTHHNVGRIITNSIFYSTRLHDYYVNPYVGKEINNECGNVIV
jgi:hypothetical protein